jgi:hypothetical protein
MHNINGTKMTTTKLNFVLPFLFLGTPNPAILMKVELRPLKNGLYRIYTDSHFELLNVGEVTLENGINLIMFNGCIAVHDEFDMYNIDDLRGIKDYLSKVWIDAYNEHIDI